MASNLLAMAAMASNPVAFLLLVMPGATSSVLATSSDALVTRSDGLRKATSKSFLLWDFEKREMRRAEKDDSPLHVHEHRQCDPTEPQTSLFETGSS